MFSDTEDENNLYQKEYENILKMFSKNKRIKNTIMLIYMKLHWKEKWCHVYIMKI